MHKSIIDLTGKTFNRLTVLKLADNNGRKGNAYWECICVCGNTAEIKSYSLKSGATQSCGCLHKERTYKHGGSGTKAYRSWVHMMHRCYNKKAFSHNYYKAKCITVCDSWKNSYAAFLEDMGTPPSDKHSIDRIDNNQGYYKENCRWATKKEQAINRSCVRQVVIGDSAYPIEEACSILGINKNTFKHNLYTRKIYVSVGKLIYIDQSSLP